MRERGEEEPAACLLLYCKEIMREPPLLCSQSTGEVVRKWSALP